MNENSIPDIFDDLRVSSTLRGRVLIVSSPSSSHSWLRDLFLKPIESDRNLFLKDECLSTKPESASTSSNEQE